MIRSELRSIASVTVFDPGGYSRLRSFNDAHHRHLRLPDNINSEKGITSMPTGANATSLLSNHSRKQAAAVFWQLGLFRNEKKYRFTVAFTFFLQGIARPSYSVSPALISLFWAPSWNVRDEGTTQRLGESSGRRSTLGISMVSDENISAMVKLHQQEQKKLLLITNTFYMGWMASEIGEPSYGSGEDRKLHDMSPQMLFLPKSGSRIQVIGSVQCDRINFITNTKNYTGWNVQAGEPSYGGGGDRKLHCMVLVMLLLPKGDFRTSKIGSVQLRREIGKLPFIINSNYSGLNVPTGEPSYGVGGDQKMHCMVLVMLFLPKGDFYTPEIGFVQMCWGIGTFCNFGEIRTNSAEWVDQQVPAKAIANSCMRDSWGLIFGFSFVNLIKGYRQDTATKRRIEATIEEEKMRDIVNLQTEVQHWRNNLEEGKEREGKLQAEVHRLILQFAATNVSMGDNVGEQPAKSSEVTDVEMPESEETETSMGEGNGKPDALTATDTGTPMKGAGGNA